MSGAITGVKSINIAPKENDSNINSMRLLINIQNIMKLESNIGIVIDALAGSYAIEDATIKIAEQAWSRLD
jgi:methylmalonyl-CoA mutase